MSNSPHPDPEGQAQARRITVLAEKILQSFVLTKVEPDVALSAVVTALGGIINWALQTALTEAAFNDFKEQVLSALAHMYNTVRNKKYPGATDARSGEADKGIAGRDGETGRGNDVPVSDGNTNIIDGEVVDSTVARDVPGSGGGDKVH